MFTINAIVIIKTFYNNQSSPYAKFNTHIDTTIFKQDVIA
jgi:hypothetical protein